MQVKFITLLLLCFIATVQLNAQSCPLTSLGQNPGTAFPVCGTDTFSQNTVPVCGSSPIPGPCGTDGLTDKNPFWYKFTCFTAGTLGFSITPANLDDDYDWQIFDITGRNPQDVYTDASLFVCCNWSGNSGKTGASSTGNSLNNCAGYSYPTFSSVPTLKQGHNYIMLVSHFTDSQSGYGLSFGGGTASITDTTPPRLKSAFANCDGMQVTVVLNKNMRCNSLAPNGSDFTISSSSISVTGASSVSCTTGFDMDSLVISLNNPLPPGTYTISANNGSDSNTLLDNCNRNVPIGDHVSFTLLPLAPTPMDSISPIGCAPNTLQLVFKKPIRCNSIAADGSDFTVTGPVPVTVTGASGVCSNGVSSTIRVQLAQPIVNAGNYQITLNNGGDNNTVFDECGEQTLAGSVINFIAADTVSATFDFNTYLGCKYDTVAFTHNGANGITSWTWTFSDGNSSNQENPTRYYSVFGQEQVSLVVSNGVCTDSSSAAFLLDNELNAAFTATDLLCPEDAAVFTNTSTGNNIVGYNWNFGNGTTSIDSAPLPFKYAAVPRETTYYVQLVVENNAGCFDTAYQPVKELYNCYIAVPSAFTPNNDGLNDYLYPLNAYKADNLEFKVYNRYGQLLFQTKDWTRKWDGTINGVAQASGTYVWMLSYTHHDTGKKYSLKGTSVLIR